MKMVKYQQNMMIVYFDTKLNNNKEERFIMSSVIRESGKQGGRALYDVSTRGEEDK